MRAHECTKGETKEGGPGKSVYSGFRDAETMRKKRLKVSNQSNRNKKSHRQLQRVGS
jgi:hypothetical protein